MENTSENECFEPEYLKELLYSGNKIPIYLKKHFKDCGICQGNLLNFHSDTPIPKRAFGKDFEKTVSSWKNELPEDSENEQDIFRNASSVYDTALFKFVYRHRLWIYILGYVSVIVAFSYFWFILISR
ncbi:hypothetical protein EHQ12_11575 [Leptospira gomenensis]|uniref:Uncharacterized protein n=1 Tax=Leptospira gomenensis TaxID=2484974 RepID=A0A5F1YBP2_9LEPT|nr:hypothetical protein [Leptospira gomenensis]TGK34936.1 hypothetical protein EHQ17_07850 [Leptospira gomenensis]TGK36732.1 hypothetical protein EHQ12_11575 [Leptospira gomenensis]TGK48863.1 hypothetical protein EHQ07_05860 [Leptospira gomenensis]TGK64629.1 hypothetical protein EHQ13_07035 [Leptospira gomenensis]